MQERVLPFSRIRFFRTSDDPRRVTAQAHRVAHLLTFTDPAYPAPARAQGIEGTVLLDAVIDREGAIQELSVRTGHASLAASALDCVRQWRYRPTKVNGIAVEVQTEIEVRFTLPDSVVSS